MRHRSEPQGLLDILPWLNHAKRITYRKCGLDGKDRRPMFHRFEVRGGVSLTEHMAGLIMRKNTLFEFLQKRGR